MTFILWLIMRAPPTSSTTKLSSISYSPILLCKISTLILRKSPPSVAFHLYDVAREMSLYEFCTVCKIPFGGSLEEPHRRDVDGFIHTITIRETRKVSIARITSIHFPVLRYFAIFASRCLIGRENCGNLSIPDIIILLQVYMVITLLVWETLLLNG